MGRDAVMEAGVLYRNGFKTRPKRERDDIHRIDNETAIHPRRAGT
ncbi:hypothetical protein NBRC116588_31470 [Pyruvatibacter sp. HU-CL02332]